MSRPKLLDMYCGPGGTEEGYRRAGFDVTGVDNKPQPHNPFPFIQADALEYVLAHGHEYDAIHASPPCQRYSIATASHARGNHPDLVAATRYALIETGKPWVIENVPGAPLLDAIVLCGTMFQLRAIDDDGTMLHLKRHRLFESNVELCAPGPCVHPRNVQWAGSYGGARRDKREAREVRHGGYVPSFPVQQRLMGIDWTTERELYLAIPPVYTEHIGAQLLAVLMQQVAA